MQMNGSTIQINGVDFYYEKFDHKKNVETILLLHGFLSSTFCYRKLAPLLANDFNVISIDYPPFGKSGKIKNFTYSYQNIAECIIKLLTQLGYEKIYAAGHSMGGQIVLSMMQKQPDLIKKGILLCSSAYLPKMKPALTYFSYLPFFDRLIKRQLGKTGVLGNLHSVVYDQKMIDEEMIQGYTDPFRDDQIFIALRKMIRDFEGDLKYDVLETINNPCLLVWGENDRIVPLNLGKRLAHDLPNAKLVVFSKTGHLLPEEKPWEVYKEIRNFLCK